MATTRIIPLHAGKGHAAHICKACAALPPEVRAEQMEMRFPSSQEPEDFGDDSEFLLDENDITE